MPPALYLANPVAPYNTTQLVNNYYGRQFNSVNDVAVNPANGDIYFTDVTYGYLQDFRPEPVLPNQAYRLNAVTKALTAVADDQINPNGEISSNTIEHSSLSNCQCRYHLLTRWKVCVYYRDGRFDGLPGLFPITACWNVSLRRKSTIGMEQNQLTIPAIWIVTVIRLLKTAHSRTESCLPT